MLDGDEIGYTSPTLDVGEAYQVSSSSDTEHVRTCPKCVFCFACAGIAWRKTAFRSSPNTCLVSDGVRLSTISSWRDVPSFTPIRHRTCVRGCPKCVFFLCTWGNCLVKKCILYELAHMFSVGWGWNMVHLSKTSCWRGLPSFTCIRLYTCVLNLFFSMHDVKELHIAFQSSMHTCLVRRTKFDPPFDTKHVCFKCIFSYAGAQIA